MAAILFSDFDAVRLVLTSGAVPTSIAQSPVRWGVDAKRRVWIEPSAPLPRSVAAALTRFGALVQGTSGAIQTEPADSWPLVLPLESTAIESSEAVLFDLPYTEVLPRFVAELRRLGAGTISLRSPPPDGEDQSREPHCLVMVERPPLATLLRAADRTADSPRAYCRQAPRVWVEWGHQHPLPHLIAPPVGHFAILAAPQSYRWLPDAPFQTAPVLFTLPRTPPAATDRSPSDWSLPIDVRLVRSGDSDPPELWVIPETQFSQLHALLAQWDDRVVATFSLAQVERTGRRMAVIRVQRGRQGGAALLLNDVMGYRPVLRMSNLFVPVGTQLQPPLRRDLVRHWLAADADSLVWLWPTTHGRFERHGLPMSAFRPMTEFLRYHVEQPAVTLSPVDEWPALPLSQFVAREPAPIATRPARVRSSPLPPKPAPPPPASEGWLQKLGKWFSPLFGHVEGPVPIPEPTAVRRTPTVLPELPPPPRQAWDQHRTELESRLLAADLTDDERRTLWPELAGLYTAINQPADAAACWLHALWENETEAGRSARGWLAAEARSANSEIDLARWLTGPSTAEHARAVAAFAVWAAAQDSAPAQASIMLARVQQVLDEHETGLPIQAAWLSRVAIGQMIGGDAVGLAQCRDRLLDRLYQHGLSADLDAPNFVRFAGQVTDERRQQVRAFLERIREPVHRWVGQEQMPRPMAELQLQQFGLGVSAAPNRAYADLMLSWGMARLGERTRCRQWLAEGSRSLPPDDPIHDFLRDAFAFRVQQALDGRHRRGPLPAELNERLVEWAARERIDSRQRELRIVYTIERFRQMSRILEPEERVRAFEEGHLQRAASLRGITNRDDLAARVTELLSGPHDPSPAALALSLDLAPRVGEAFAASVLDRLRSVVDRWEFTGEGDRIESEAAALERGWFVAAHFDRTDAARHLLDGLGRLLDAQRLAASAPPAAESAVLGLVGQALRGLRRLGWRAESERLLEQLSEWASPPAPEMARVAALIRRLLVAAGWFYVGRQFEAMSALDDARLALLSRRLGAREQSQLVHAYVSALGHAPVGIALGRIQEVFEQVENVADQQITNSHFSLSRLRVVEAAVLAVVNEDFALGAAVRRWLDDDEFRVRRRIHRDMARWAAPD